MERGSLIERVLLAQRGTLMLWLPVCLACGIGIYFSLPIEPDRVQVQWAALLAMCLIALSRIVGTAYQPLFLAALLVLCGVGLAKWRTQSVDAPTLTYRYYGPIEGRIVAIDRSASDAVRLTLDQVRLSRMSPERIPTKVRVSIHGDQPERLWGPGDRIMTTGHLSRPSGPAEPGSFDFQRHAFFLQIGAVGYTRNPVLRQKEHVAGLTVFRLRLALADGIRSHLDGAAGAFAAAIITGDRSAIPITRLKDLRRSNLAHLLAISGLHMGLLTGLVYACLRFALVLSPAIALHWPVRKIAAAAAIIAGAAYLVLSGANVATERAFIMVAVMFLAVILDRRALTLRAVAIAATLVLILRPEALSGPGFQMSFAATTALVITFRGLRRFDQRRWPRWSRAIGSVVISSFIAGMATAPFAAAHFNMVSQYGLIANLVSVPLMGALIMPAGLLALLAWPLGLAGYPLWVMGWGLEWIMLVAASVSDWDNSVRFVVAPAGIVLPLLTLGLLWTALWIGRLRWIGMPVAALAFVFWGQGERPAVLVAESGSMMGVMGPEGRAVSRPTGSSFVVGIWLENDGDGVVQDIAASRVPILREERVFRARIGDHAILQVSGKTALAGLDGCAGAAVLISNVVDLQSRDCLVLDQKRLSLTGSVAMDLAEDGTLILRSAALETGERPWTVPAPRSDIALVAIPVSSKEVVARGPD